MSALRRVAVFAVPAVLYFAVRPFTESDAVALAIAGALPLAYQMIVVLVGRRVDGWAVVSGIGYVLAGRLINWGTLAVGAVLLWAYLRRLRAAAAGAAS